MVTAESDRWEAGDERVRDRLDMLLLDTTGSLVIAELKRYKAPDTADLQALEYAANCSQLRKLMSDALALKCLNIHNAFCVNARHIL